MVSLINKQLLLTAYAYLFIMGQQEAQQGGEALQFQVERSKQGASAALHSYQFSFAGLDQNYLKEPGNFAEMPPTKMSPKNTKSPKNKKSQKSPKSPDKIVEIGTKGAAKEGLAQVAESLGTWVQKIEDILNCRGTGFLVRKNSTGDETCLWYDDLKTPHKGKDGFEVALRNIICGHAPGEKKAEVDFLAKINFGDDTFCKNLQMVLAPFEEDAKRAAAAAEADGKDVDFDVDFDVLVRAVVKAVREFSK